MLDNLRKLVFGLGEFEKIRIDERFRKIESLLNSVQISNLEDFEAIEECLYKLKEQLRIKSSNLNRVIRDLGCNISKKQVLNVIEKLDSIRQDFLRRAVLNTNNVINKPQEKEESEERKEEKEAEKEEELAQTSQEQSEEKGKEEPEEKEESLQTNKKQEKKKEQDKPIKKPKPGEIELIEKDDYKVILHNGKTPYLVVKFKNEINYAIIRDLSMIFFETYNMEGTNIIIEKNTVLIISRLENDNLLNLPRINSDLDKIFENLASKEIDERQEEYKDIKEYKSEGKIQTRKNEEDSLDDLLSSALETSQTPPPKPKQDKSTPQIIEGKSIEIEKKPKKKDNDIEIIKDDIKDKLENIGKETQTPLKNELEDKVEEVQTPPKEEQEHKTEEIETNKEENQFEDEEREEEKQENHLENKENENENEEKLKTIHLPFELYRDENIIAYLKEDSQVKGEIVLRPFSNKSLRELSESEISYITIFSKVFAQALFEVTQAQGTNIIWNYNDNIIQIIPRFDNDKINLNWELKSEKEEFLEQIRNKLIKTMQEEISTDKKEKQESQPAPNENLKENEIKERAEYVMESVRRLP